MLRTLLLAGVLAVAFAAPAAAQNPWLGDPVMNIAHQGGEDEFPSNTMYAFRKAMAAGADMLELDVHATADGRLIVMHDWTVDRTTDGTGYAGRPHARADPPARRRLRLPHAAPLRGIRTGDRKPPRGFKRKRLPRADARRGAAALPADADQHRDQGPRRRRGQFLRNAELLAAMLDGTRRRDLIVVSFNQRAVDRFHELVTEVAVAPGVDGIARFLLGGQSPGPGVVALQIPITFGAAARRSR